MNIGIASGKGGTGKTTVAINLALSLGDVDLFDCDVEEPNCNLFLELDLEEVEAVKLPTPVVDRNMCDLCGKCSEFCKYNAIAVIPGNVMIFDTLCHGCGGCSIVCPKDAITEEDRTIGTIERSISSDGLQFYRGLLYIGEPMASPVIKGLQRYASDDRISIFDAPPGTACPLITCMDGMDYCILVAEPTPFGFHDMLLSVEVLKTMEIPFGVVINRFDMGDGSVEKYCKENEIPVLMNIPHDRRIANLYSKGIPFVKEMPEWKEKFVQMFEGICPDTGGMSS